MEDFLSWFISFLILCCVFCILGYQIICLADLETDYINPYDTSTQINKVILPEFVSQGVLCCSYLLTGQWFLFLLSLPCLYYNYTLYSSKRDKICVTEIYRNLNKEKQKRLYKLYYLLTLMVISVFGIIWQNIDNI